jgi:glycosyltransferase involved in cell wall biosynthesis
MINEKKKLLLLFQWSGGGIPEVYRTLIGAGAFQSWDVQQAIYGNVPKKKHSYFKSLGRYFYSSHKFSFTYFSKLSKETKQADLIVANTIICLLSLLFLRTVSVPIIFHIHGEYPYIMGGNGLLNVIKRRLFKLLCSTLNVELVLCVNKNIQKRLKIINIETKSLVIDNGTSKPEIAIETAEERILSRTVIGMGRLDSEKAFDRFIDIANLVIMQDESVQFKIFGEGILKQNLEYKIKELALEKNIHLRGYTNDPLSEMNKCSLLLMTSKNEGSPMVFPESLSIGLPFVSTPVGTARYLFRNLTCVKVSDSDEVLAQNILNILNMTSSDYEEQMMIGIDFFSNEMIVDNKVSLYENAFLSIVKSKSKSKK